MRKRRRQDLWTADEDVSLRKLAISGISLTEISKQMGRAKSSVRARATKLQIAIARDQNGSKKGRALKSRLRQRDVIGDFDHTIKPCES
jgi:hypothetical protein